MNVHGGEAYEPVRDAEEAASPFFVVFVFVFVSVSERPGSMMAHAWRAGRLDAGGVEVVDADREACHRGEENVRAIATGRMDRLIFLVDRSRYHDRSGSGASCQQVGEKDSNLKLKTRDSVVSLCCWTLLVVAWTTS